MDKYLAAIGILYLVAVAWPLSKTDIREHRLPNKYVLPAFPVILLGQIIAELASGQWWRIWLSLAATGLALGIGVLANRYASLGMGDVKLIAAIVQALAWYSPILPLLALLFAFVIASAVVVVKVALRKSSFGSTIALGPFLLSGFAITLLSIGW